MSVNEMSFSRRSVRRVVPLAGSLLLTAACALGTGPSVEAPRDPPEVEAVLRYAAGPNHPEVAYGREYPLRIRGYGVRDIDGDGVTEVVLWADPHLLQSPTLTIYSVDESGRVTRAIEGLAPGPLVPATGGLADTHVMGLGVDFPVDAASEDGAADISRLEQKSLERGLHTVRYRDFLHTDARGGQRGYVDLSRADPLGTDRICGTFEFAPIESLAVGSLLEDREGGYVVAATSGRLYLYRIDAIRPDGLLDKQPWIVDQPAGYLDLATSDDGVIEYESVDGSRHPVSREPAAR